MAGARDELGLTPKQRVFADSIAEANTQYDSYVIAYDTHGMSKNTIKQRAHEEANKPHVAKAVVFIKEQTSKHMRYDKEAHFRELDALKDIALQNSDQYGNKTSINTAQKITELKGKMCGHYVDKVDVTSGNEPISINIVVGGK